MANPDARLAVLIDSDNVAPDRVGVLLAEIATYGVAAVRRMYGDWTSDRLRKWKPAANEHAIQPIQQFAYTTGKNATDSAMIIDAMDLRYTERFDGFCLVSSDSDFTRLASRLRESGVTVYGFGERKTPKAFVTACDRFVYLDVLGSEDEEAEKPISRKRRTVKELRSDQQLVQLLHKGVDAASDDDGWSDLGRVGKNLRSLSPDFDPRNWGFAKLGDLVAAVGLFTVDRVVEPSGQATVRVKRKAR